MSDAENQNEFQSLMLDEGVKPLKTANRVSVRDILRRGEMDGLVERRRAAEGVSERFRLEPDQLINPFDPISWKRDGVQEGVFRNLRLGKYQADARLDLVNRSLNEAIDEVPAFIKQSYRFGLRTVIISHGRPKTQADYINRLRSSLALWLPKIDEVLAFHSTQPQHGGLSALYLLLRKNEQQRLDNQERFRS